MIDCEKTRTCSHFNTEFDLEFYLEFIRLFHKINKVLCGIELLEFETNISSILIDLETIQNNI